MYVIAEDKGDWSGYLDINVGGSFNNGRYVVHKYLDYAPVYTHWLAWDTIHSEYVTLKVFIRKKVYSENAKEEITILQQVANGDQMNERRVVKLLDHFVHSGPRGDHVCMVLEYLGDNLLTLIKCLAPNGLPLHIVKKLCLEILDGLDYLHTQLSLIHGDVKLTSICLGSTFDPFDDTHKPGAPPSQTYTASDMAHVVLDHDIKLHASSVEAHPSRKAHSHL